MKKLMFQRIITVAVLLFSVCSFGEEPVKSPVPSNEKIHQILTERLGESADHVGIAEIHFRRKHR